MNSASVYDQDDNLLMRIAIQSDSLPRKGDYLALTMDDDVRYVIVQEVWWLYKETGTLALLSIRTTDASSSVSAPEGIE